MPERMVTTIHRDGFVRLVVYLFALCCMSVSCMKLGNNVPVKNLKNFQYYNVGVLMASQLDSPFDLERCGPAVDLALEEVNERFLSQHGIRINKVQARYIFEYLL